MKRKKYLCRTAILTAVVFVLHSGTIYASGSEGACFYIGKIPISEDCADPEDAAGSDRILTEESAYHHWNVGDTVVCGIDGQDYRFRCIDQNYWDQSENHRQCALFLCETVIPANTGSRYILEKLEDGSHGYVFYAGPVVSFGDSNEYKYSDVRSWLSAAAAENFTMAEPVYTGISYAYTGKTKEGLYDQLNSVDLKAEAVGSQNMTDQLFVLSVDEALRYKEWLWRFGGAGEQNPQSQIDEYCKGYWLRNPAGTYGNHDTDQVYIVDLVNGNIRPEWISVPASVKNSEAESFAEDDELAKTGVIGVRPAFALAQDRG